MIRRVARFGRRVAEKSMVPAPILLVLLVLMAAAVISALSSGFYCDSSNWRNLLVELHGVVLEVAALSVIAAWFLSRKTRTEYSPIIASLRARLLVCSSGILRSLPLSTNVGPTVVFRFGSHAAAAPAKLRSGDRSLLSAEVLTAILNYPSDDEYAAAGSTPAAAREARTRALRSHLSELHRQSTQMVTLMSSLAALPQEAADPHLLELTQNTEGHLEQVSVALDALLLSERTTSDFQAYALFSAQLATAALELSRYVIALSDEEATFDQLVQKVQGLTRSDDSSPEV